MKWRELMTRVASGPKLGDPHHPRFADAGNARRWFVEDNIAVGVWGHEILIGYASRLDTRDLPRLKAVRALTENNLTFYADTFRKDGSWWRMDTDETELTEDFIRFYVRYANPDLETFDVPNSRTGRYNSKWGSGYGRDSEGRAFRFVRTNGIDHYAYEDENGET